MRRGERALRGDDKEIFYSGCLIKMKEQTQVNTSTTSIRCTVIVVTFLWGKYSPSSELLNKFKRIVNSILN